MAVAPFVNHQNWMAYPPKKPPFVDHVHWKATGKPGSV